MAGNDATDDTTNGASPMAKPAPKKRARKGNNDGTPSKRTKRAGVCSPLTVDTLEDDAECEGAKKEVVVKAEDSGEGEGIVDMSDEIAQQMDTEDAV